MNLNLYEPPVTNRGVVNTINAKVPQPYLLFDWIQCTIYSTDDIFYLFNYLFNIKYDDVFIEDKGLYYYSRTYSYKHIKFLINDKREDMGIHLLMSGSACRDFEDLNLDYKTFFKKLVSLGARFTRLDVSVDVFLDNYFSIDKINNCIFNNEVLSRFKNSVQYLKTNLSNCENKGNTIWFDNLSCLLS